MAKGAAKLQRGCVRYQESLNIWESLFIQETRNCRQPYLDFLQYRLLPPNCSETIQIQRKSSTFFIKEAFLFRRGLDQASFRCIAGDEVVKVLEEVHTGDCGEHH